MLRCRGMATVALVSVLALGGRALADEATPAGSLQAGSLTDPSRFEHAYGASFYGFDACGESLTGKELRRVLEDKFAQCPFTPEARARFARWTKGQQAKSAEAIKDMIIAHGGLPVRLEGMALTCHEQFTSPANQQLRDALDRYQQGKIDANAILPAPCNAPEISP